MHGNRLLPIKWNGGRHQPGESRRVQPQRLGQSLTCNGRTQPKPSKSNIKRHSPIPICWYPASPRPQRAAAPTQPRPPRPPRAQRPARRPAVAGGGLSGGVIAGIVIAAVAFIAILVALFFVLGRNRVYSQWMSSQDGRTERTARWAFFNNAGGSHGNRKSELDSNTPQTPGIDVTSVGSPDPTIRHFSPGPESVSAVGTSSPLYNAGQWNWEVPQNPRSARPPTELEAHNIIHQLPERRGS